MELLGKMPLKVTRSGQYAKDMFDSRGNLRNVRELRFWSGRIMLCRAAPPDLTQLTGATCAHGRDLKNLLMEKYDFTDGDAEGFSNYLLPMLEFDPADRTTARACADHEWAAGGDCL